MPLCRRGPPSSKTGQPSAEIFLERFGNQEGTAEMAPRPLTGALLVQPAKAIKPSSCSLNQWRPQALQALALWRPSLFTELAQILRRIEKHGVWPTALASAYVSLIPKADLDESPLPTDYRPISVLSAVYRLWSSFRFQVCLAWQESWAPQEMWRCRLSRGAETMGLATAMQLVEEAKFDTSLVAGGICFDFRKAFDLIPESLLFAALEHRGMHACILIPLQGLYKQLRRVFRLTGSISSWWTSGAISMIGLNSLVATVLEVSQACCPEIIGRAYADDLSGTAVSHTPDSLLNSVRHFNQIVRALESTGFGEISQKKTHTFGNACLKNQVDPNYTHHTAFRLVGASILSEDAQAKESEVESSRINTWARTVKTCAMRPTLGAIKQNICWQPKRRPLTARVPT